MRLVLSPHLDDAVLSTFALLRDGWDVLTIFAGIPTGRDASAWDRCCGFVDPVLHMQTRHAENVDVLGRLGVAHTELAYLEWPHHRPGLDARPDVESLATLIHAWQPDADEVAAPVALSPTPNPDHVLAREAALVGGGLGFWRARLYGDVPHVLKGIGEWPQPVDEHGPPPPPHWTPLSGLPVNGVTVTRLDDAAAEQKAMAMRGYSTQFRALTTMLRAPGRYVLRRPFVYSVEPTWEMP